jgi:hypothetical protein
MDLGGASTFYGGKTMTEDQDYPGMSEETKAAIATASKLLATAKQDGAYALFTTPILQAFGDLYARDDFWTHDGRAAIHVLEEEVKAVFEARESDLQMEWLPMLKCWYALCGEAHRSGKAT